MEQIAFINGGTFIYWSSIILALGVVTAAALFAAFYLYKSGNVLALCLMVPGSTALSIVLSRLIHWYCRSDAYASLQAAMTDYTWGGYALMGAFAGCLIMAVLLRLLRISKNLPEMLDCLVLSGGVGIAVGRLASFFNSSDRGMILDDAIGLPFAWPVTNAVSGVSENRLAVFLLQAILVLVLVSCLLLLYLVSRKRQRPLRDGDITLLFLLVYGCSQVIFDSTRYDSLFMRSNGFISIVQILGALGLLTAAVVFSVYMVKRQGLRWYQFVIWAGFLALVAGAGYMEYYVQRHGDQAAFSYCMMAGFLTAVVVRTISIWKLGLPEGTVRTAEAPEEQVSDEVAPDASAEAEPEETE